MIKLEKCSIAAILAILVSAPAKSDSFTPQTIQFGTTAQDMEVVLAPLCVDGIKTRPIDPPFLPDVREQQLQIDCDGFAFQGAPRWAEFVIGDNTLKMVWIMLEPEDQDSVVAAMTDAFGPPSHNNDHYIAFTQARAAWRFEPAEVLFYSQELDSWILPWFETNGEN